MGRLMGDNAHDSDRLGYGEQTSFGRAFKRWTGMTPAQFRESILDHPRPVEAAGGTRA